MAAPSSSSSSFPTLLRHPLSSPTTRPPADDLANTWILEFILRQPIPDFLANEIFLSLHFSSSNLHPHLRKTVLLRRISSDLRRRSLSERTLHSLELIVELDRHSGSRPSHRLKAAYCATAVECTAAAFFRSGRDSIDFVERFWMAEAAEGLVSEQLIEWRKRMERCLSSGERGEEILKRDAEDAMSSVRDYLEEALQDMGPPFLEIAAAEFVGKRLDLNAVVDKVGKVFTEMNVCFEELDETDDELETDGGRISMGIMEEGGVVERSGGMTDTSRRDLRVGGIREESDGLGKASAMQGADFNGVVGSGFDSVEMEVDNEKGVNYIPDHSGCNILQVAPDEVSKVKDALKKSSFDLKRMVEDPLPEAQAVAAAVLDSISRVHDNEAEKQISVENPVLPVSPVDPVAGNPPGMGCSTDDLEKEKWNLSVFKQMEGNHIDAGPSKRREVVANHGISERNPTAHISESIEDSLESSVPTEKLKSPNPTSRGNSLARLCKGKLIKRRAVKRWTQLEEHTLREAVAKYGKGNWKLILNRHSEIFGERTEVDLKDKWRNMARHLL
ncbi:uncharacterized protein LOC110115337 isoform X2 [Dendrobium catenatum]|uniref:uncharacterized protein LOC110115337 isoform X2 n=1 Tax=Dendrobium catenatum TaxID=906689 RepID=UPI0010A04228|nr:uncharacterized protein LOC110115337 isoform X2 [Dendrobium catenatum]